MTLNELVGKIAHRAKVLADLKLDDLRSMYPAETETQGQLVRYCKENKIGRGDCLEALIIEEFGVETYLDHEIGE